MTEQLKHWWEGLSEREQQLSLVSAAVLLLAVVYWGVWKPLDNQFQQNQQRLINSEQTLAWVEEKAGVLVRAGIGKERAGLLPLTLQQIVSRSAKQHGIKFSRIENKKDQIEVVIADIEFDQFIRWLTALSNEHFIVVISTDFSKSTPQGHVKVNRLVLAN